MSDMQRFRIEIYTPLGTFVGSDAELPAEEFEGMKTLFQTTTEKGAEYLTMTDSDGADVFITEDVMKQSIIRLCPLNAVDTSE